MYEKNTFKKSNTKKYIGKSSVAFFFKMLLINTFYNLYYDYCMQEGRGINRNNSYENLETPHLAPAIFSHLPGFYLKTGILNPSPLLDYWTLSLISNPALRSGTHPFVPVT